MKIEVGKFYKHKDGRKVEVLKTESCIVAFANNGQGRSVYLLDAEELVSEWEEPKPKLKAHIDKHGRLWFSPVTPPDSYTPAPWLDEPEENNES